MEDQAEAVKRLVQEDTELEARMDAEAKATAHALIQGYVGPDHKVMVMSEFGACSGVEAGTGEGADG